MAINNHQLDVARSFLEFIVDRHGLVLRDIVVDVQVIMKLFLKLRIEFVSDHLVSSALEGEKLARVVVAETDVVGHYDATAAGGQDLGDQWGSVEVGCLDENACAGVAEGRQECFVLRRIDAGVIGGAPGFAADHGYWERGVGREWDQMGGRLGRIDVWRCAFGIWLDCGVWKNVSEESQMYV